MELTNCRVLKVELRADIYFISVVEHLSLYEVHKAAALPEKIRTNPIDNRLASGYIFF
jgi:hypothetical protein